MGKLLKWIGIIFVVLMIIGFLAGNDKNSTENTNVNKLTNENTSNNESKSKYALNDKENTVLNYLLEEELNLFIQGEDTLLQNGLIVVSSNEVAKAYEDNQVGADQKYYKKMLYLKGRVESINSGLGNEPYLALNGSNQFLNPQVHFDEPNIDKISNIKKGEVFTFVCVGNGSIVGTPMFKDCVFAEDYANTRIAEIRKDIDRVLNGSKNKLEDSIRVLVISLHLAKVLPENAKCFTDKTACEEEINLAMKDIKEADLLLVAKELKDKIK